MAAVPQRARCGRCLNNAGIAALVQIQADRQATAIALIQSLGGGWEAKLE